MILPAAGSPAGGRGEAAHAAVAPGGRVMPAHAAG